jgi:hypothetical protein
MKNYKTLSEKCLKENLLREEQFSKNFLKEDEKWNQEYFEQFGKYPSKKC